MSIALVNCPACSRQVSPASSSCIGCGHPIKSLGKSTVVVAWLFGAVFVIALGFQLHKKEFIHSDFLDGWMVNDKINLTSQIPEPSEGSERVRPEISTMLLSARTKKDLSDIARQLNNKARPYWNQYYKVDRIAFEPTERLLRISYWVQPDISELEIPIGVFVKSYCRDEAYQIFRDYNVAGHVIFKNQNSDVLSRTIHPEDCF